MKASILVTLVLVLASLLIVSPVSKGLYQDSESVVIHEDGSVTPQSAPVVRSGEAYTLKDDIYIPRSTNDGIDILRSGVTLDGAGHVIRGNGQGSAIHFENLTDVTIKNVLLNNFYWGIEIWRSTGCTIYNSNLTAVMYPIYLQYSSGNLFYHNNIYQLPYYESSDNKWDNGYPIGGNYWNGYPYPDNKSGPSQDLPGSDGIGDVKVGEEMFPTGANVDNYPLFKKVDLAGSTQQSTQKSNLRLVVKDAQGQPMQGANVTSSTQPSGQVSLSGSTGTDGVASFNDVSPGVYTFMVSKSGYTPSSGFATGLEGNTTEVVVTLQVAPPNGKLTITVKDNGGAVISGATVSSTSQPSGQLTISGTTGEAGQVTFNGIQLGSYTIQATKSGYDSNSVQCEVTQGGTSTLSMTIQAQQTSSGGGSGGVPGFPYEALIIGVLICVLCLSLSRSRKLSHE
jgi:parallel beta-helix repeat protein